MKLQNVIQRQKLDPLLAKACEVRHHYEKATDCFASVVGPDRISVNDYRKARVTFFCTLCKHHYRNSQKVLGPLDYPCNEKHFKAIEDSQRLGGSYIYMCDMGFVFWASPLFSGKHYAGGMIGSGVLGVKQNLAVENLYKAFEGKIPRKEIGQHLEGIPEKNFEEIKAMAHMMMICAEQLSQNEGEVPASPSDFSYAKGDVNKERTLLASLRRGDTTEARKIMTEILENPEGGIESLQVRAIELAVLISRAAASVENADTPDILEANNRYLKKIEDAQNVRELTEILNSIIDLMSGRMFSFQGIRHSSALRKAERFILENLTHKISLQKIAQAAGLSAPYFSTIFKEEMGENLSNYINRLRVERAAAMLVETTTPISKIATDCGFEDQSWFSKIFKSHTKISPGKYRDLGGICAAPDLINGKTVNNEEECA
jgi:AraC-like DNA-binding protein/ligand-binding sensor protein